MKGFHGKFAGYKFNKINKFAGCCQVNYFEKLSDMFFNWRNKMTEKSLQEQFAPNSICFGCGPGNVQGLHIRSFSKGDEVIAHWHAESHHQAFSGVLNGGIIGVLLDCHCNWAAAYHLMKINGLTKPPCTVTADYTIKLLRPTPSDDIIELTAKIISAKDDRVMVKGELHAKGKICAICEGTFVAVKPGHPAYHRW